MDTTTVLHREAWNKGKLVGQKAPFKLREIWAIRIRLQMQGRLRELALFDLGIDSKLRACDLVKLRVRDVCELGVKNSRSTTSGHVLRNRHVVWHLEAQRRCRYARSAIRACYGHGARHVASSGLAVSKTSTVPAALGLLDVAQ
jgi:hypothetical protein